MLNNKKIFNNRIGQLRKKLGLTQASLGNSLNMSQQAIAKWETGDSEPDSGNIIKLTELFNVSSDYLLGITDNPTPTDKDLTVEMQLAIELSRMSGKQQKDLVRYAQFLRTQGEFSDEVSIALNTLVQKPLTE